jgi:DNA polymerase-3 subunit alpha
MRFHWPTEFYSALLNAFIDISDKVKAYLGQASRSGIKMLPPDINRSECLFKPEDGNIRFGLQGISGLKSQAVGIVSEREAGGCYEDFQDLYDRMANRNDKLNRKAVEGLVWGGAMSELPNSENKAALLKMFPLLESNYKHGADLRQMGQMCLFAGAAKVAMPEMLPVSADEALRQERTALGMYISGHPSDQIIQYAPRLRAYVPVDCLASHGTDQMVDTMGVISRYREFFTRSHERMCVFDIETKFASFRCVVFPKTFAQYADKLDDDRPVCVRGRVSYDAAFETHQMVVDSVMDEVDVRAQFEPMVMLVRNRGEQDRVMAAARRSPGTHPLVLTTPYGRQYKTTLAVQITPALIEMQRSGAS